MENCHAEEAGDGKLWMQLRRRRRLPVHRASLLQFTEEFLDFCHCNKVVQLTLSYLLLHWMHLTRSVHLSMQFERRGEARQRVVGRTVARMQSASGDDAESQRALGF